MASQHIVIVGGSSGLGLATANRLLLYGDIVTITGRDQARLDRAAQELGGGVNTVRMDAAATGALRDAFAGIGPFDHLVLALGSNGGAGPFATIDVADVKRGFEEKVYPHFAAAQAALPQLSKTGSITFVSAVSAVAAVPGTAGIGAQNAAVAALAPILAVELKPLRVNAVAPGVIDTPWWDAMPAEQKEAIFEDLGGKTPVGRNGLPDDVAQAIALLVNNTFITGQIISVDGGLRFTA